MVDVQAVNKKLRRRSEDMLLRISGCSREEVREALDRANGSVKLAVILLRGCDVTEGTALLDRAGGQLRAALALVHRRGEDAA